MFDTSPDSILLVNRAGNIVLANRQVEKVLGYSLEDLVGQSVEILIPERFQRRHSDQFKRFVRNPPRHPLRSEFEFRALAKDGRELPVDITLGPVQTEDGLFVLTTIRDKAPLIKALKDLKEKTICLRTLIDKNPLGIVVLDSQHRVKMCNRAFEQLFQHCQKELLNCNIDSLITNEETLGEAENLTQAVLRGKNVQLAAKRYRKDGTQLDVEIQGLPLVVGGTLKGVYGLYRDVTEERRAHQQLRLTQFAMDHCPNPIYWIDRDGKLDYVNEAACRSLGYSQTELLSMNITDIDPDLSSAQYLSAWEKIKKWNSFKFEARHETKERRIFPVDISSSFLRFDGKEYSCTFVCDITDRKRVEKELNERETLFRTLAETIPFGVLISEGDKVLYANPAVTRITGYSNKEMLNSSPWSLAHPDHRELLKGRVQARLRGEDVPNNYESKIVTKTGEERCLDIHATRMMLQGGPAILAAGIDITERKEAENALKSSEEMLRSITESYPDIILKAALDGTIQYINQTQHSGLTRESIIGTSIYDHVSKDSRKLVEDCVSQVLQTRKVSRYEANSAYLDSSGRPLVYAAQVAPVMDDEELEGLLFNIRDITEQARAKEAFRNSEDRFRTLVQNSSDIITLLDQAGTILFVSPAASRILGYENEEFQGRNALDFVYPEDVSRIKRFLDSPPQSNETSPLIKVRCRHKDGTWKTLESVGGCLPSTIGLEKFVINSRDITESIALAEQLRHAQKMDAVGRLAGGVAHDFNNLLMIIKGYTELYLSNPDVDESVRSAGSEISSAADRATSLTRQLLAFSRKQVLAPRVVEINQIVSQVEKMLRRLINVDIEIVTSQSTDTCLVSVDPGQFEQVILNLAINARDAMPDGGKLTMETSAIDLVDAYRTPHFTIQPGSYVQIHVKDSGIGMDKDTLGKIFEPFFTTKEEGKGTGLGLAMVYGIVKQSGGFILVESTPNEGTSVKILLGRISDVREDQVETITKARTLGGNETILLVDDQEPVRTISKRILQFLGYRVLEAVNGNEALEICRNNKDKIHLLMTDLQMPDLNGNEVASRFLVHRPQSKVLIVSGHPMDDELKDQMLGKNTHTLYKPFSIAELGRKILEVLRGSQVS